MAVSRILFLGVACALTLGACGVGKDVDYIRKSIAGKKDQDVAVTTNAPLATPPGYALRPPSDSKSAGNRSMSCAVPSTSRTIGTRRTKRNSSTRS